MKITDEAVDAFTQYRRKQIAELRPYQNGEDMIGVSISAEDYKRGSPKSGDMIARNPKNHADQWMVAAAYFAENFEPIDALPPAPVGVTDEMVEIVAKKVADFLGYAWKGLSTHSVVEQGCRMFTHGQFGWSFHGGQPDLRNVARDLLEAALASHEPAPTVANAELQQEVETLREGIKEIAERERGIRDNWTRFEAETGARTLELQADLEVANDKVERLRKYEPWDFPADIQNLTAQLEASNARNAELVKALELFAEVAFDEHDDLPDNTVVVIKHEKLLDVTFTLGDFRRARAALGGQSNG